MGTLRSESPEAAWHLLTTLVPPEQQAAMVAALVRNHNPAQSAEGEPSGMAWVAAWPSEWKLSAPPMGGDDAALREGEFQRWLALGAKLSPAEEARGTPRREDKSSLARAPSRLATAPPRRYPVSVADDSDTPGKHRLSWWARVALCVALVPVVILATFVVIGRWPGRSPVGAT